MITNDKSIIIQLPRNVYSNYSGYCNIINLLNPFLNSLERCDVVFDFENLIWYDANLLPIIGVCKVLKDYLKNVFL